MCLDAVVTPELSSEAQEGEDPGDARPDGAFGPEDLIIQIHLLGSVNAFDDPGAVAKEIGRLDVDDWDRALSEREATLESARPDLMAAAYVIDAVIDPGLGLGTHHYRELWATRVFTRVTVSSGQVRAGLCRSSYLPVRWLTRAAVTAGDLSDNQNAWFVYDLGVRGLTASNRYQLTASWWIPGWNAGYWSSAPSGGYKGCYT